MSPVIHIRSAKFPILPNEQDELINEGMYGKALAEYLRAKLCERGYDAPGYCCEDWGWWVELRGAPFKFGTCIYARPDQKSPTEYACTDGALRPRQWSWSKFRFIDTAPWANKLHEDLLGIFRDDPEIEVTAVSEHIQW